MKAKSIILLLAWSTLMADCQSDDDGQAVPQERTAPIAFSVEVASDEMTRGANAMNTSDALATKGGFGVFASYTGLHKFVDSSIQSDFMYNTHVAYDDVNSVWSYDPVKYWPNGEGQASGAAKHYVSFFAYAPYSDQDPENAAGYCIPSFHLQHEVTNPWLTYRLHTDPAQQVDLMYAVPLLDRSKGDVPTREVFTFRHALACVGDRVTVSVDDALKTAYRALVGGATVGMGIELTGITLNYRLTERARLVLWTGGEANWQPIVSGDALTSRQIVVKDIDDGSPYLLWNYDSSLGETNTPWTDDGHGIFYIPLHLSGAPQTVEVTIDYNVITTRSSGAVVHEGKRSTTTLTLSDFGDAYQAGRHLNLNMKLVSS